MDDTRATATAPRHPHWWTRRARLPCVRPAPSTPRRSPQRRRRWRRARRAAGVAAATAPGGGRPPRGPLPRPRRATPGTRQSRRVLRVLRIGGAATPAARAAPLRSCSSPSPLPAASCENPQPVQASSATGREYASRHARRHAVRRRASAASGTRTTAPCTIRGWAGSPSICDISKAALRCTADRPM